jgi:two-component system sensor histidine kinase MprB
VAVPSDDRVRTPPGWLKRPAGTNSALGEAPSRASNNRAAWDALIAEAQPADVRDTAALSPAIQEPAAPVPLKVRQWRALPHMLATAVANLTLKTRVGALVAIVVGITVAMTSLAAFFTIRAQFYNSFDRSLERRAEAVAQSPTADIQGIVRFPSGILAAADTRLALVFPDGTPLAARPEVAPPLGPAETAVAAGRKAFSIRTAVCGGAYSGACLPRGAQFRVVAIPKIQSAEGNARIAFVFAQSTDDINAKPEALGTALLVIGVAGVALASYAGVLVARRGLRPVSDLTQAAEHIAETGELQPIKVRGDDELARLGTSFNAMLKAVERAQERQRRLVADAGHELRTPLTSLRTNLDLLRQAEAGRGLSAHDKAELMDDVVAQVEELTGLVSDLVELARDDVQPAEGRPVDLVEVVAAAVERARRRAPEVTFDVWTRPWTVFGDARALERAVLNLLDNAGKWSPPGGTVTLRLSDGVIMVDDEGPGIAEADLPFVFDRFYRSEESRTMPGSGLGLAIVRQAAERHGGEVTADRAPQGGARMRLTLPHSSSVTHTAR